MPYGCSETKLILYIIGFEAYSISLGAVDITIYDIHVEYMSSDWKRFNLYLVFAFPKTNQRGGSNYFDLFFDTFFSFFIALINK